MSTLTPAQGKYLTSLLNTLTEAAPRAGVEARTRLHAQYAEGTLTKAEASRAIDVLKRAIALAGMPSTQAVVVTPAPVPAPAPVGEDAATARRRQAAARLEGAQYRRSRRQATQRGRNGILALIQSPVPATAEDLAGCPF